MKEHDLLAAVGGVDDRFLEELEQTPARRLPRHFGLIAALIALLLTACAAPAVIQSFDKVRSGKRAEEGGGYQIRRYSAGSKTEEDSYFVFTGVSLEVDVAPDAPDTIETRYLPLELLEYCRMEEYSETETELSVMLSMKVPEYDRAYGICYRQYVLPKDGNVQIEGILDSLEWEASTKTYGDVTAMEFQGLASYRNSDGDLLLYDGNYLALILTKQIFWSDGNYLYYLKFPITYRINDDVIEKIVTSLTAVEGISEYLPAAE